MTFAWAASTVQAPLDVTFTVSEGVFLNEVGVGPCPLRVNAVQGPQPQGSFGCTFRFFSDPGDAWTAGDDDPTLGRVGTMDPADRVAFPDILPDPPFIPLPPAAWLVAAGVAGWLGVRRRRRPR